MTASSLKQFALGLAKAFVAVVLVFGLFIAYVTYSENSASGRAETFCREISIGSATSEILDRAISLGADKRQTVWFKVPHDPNDQLPVTFTGTTGVSRHICWIAGKDGHVVSRKVVYLD
ncbi:MAG: hypothetical protein EON58_22890 [Alphaproteobacteria bacterium]|nr:MAG: hypothetical protein EON58_22890 [Alphaproteobacteria bacterium]